MRQFKYLLWLTLLFLMEACYQEYVIVPEYKSNVYNFVLSPTTEVEILEARDRQFDITPKPFMYYGEIQYDVDNVRVRGRSATSFQRKSYAVNLSDFMVFETDPGQYQQFEKFKLIAMCQDYTYIENRVAHSFLKQLRLWPLYTFYTEVMLNNHHQGLYLFIEDPEENSFNRCDAEVVIRRHYKGGINKLDINTNLTGKDSLYFARAFKSIYETLPDYSGEQLFNKLTEKMNLQNYMRKIAFDYLIKNGDYNDEIYFYGKTKSDGSVYFDVIPWDYDDLFSTKPHEVGRDWAVGRIFGERIYNTKEDVLAVVGDRLVYSIEDDIDYLIATDDYLYQQYLKEVRYVLNVITSDRIDQVFDEVYSELLPFYEKPEIIEQSKFDADSTSLALLEQNIVDKSELLKNRIVLMTDELEKQAINK